jgi:hypothetical protein
MVIIIQSKEWNIYFEQLKKFQVFLYKECVMDNIRGPNVFSYYKVLK